MINIPIKIEKKIPWFLFIIVFTVYIINTCPSVYWYDSGEFISYAHFLGITHPTGYPLYMVLAKFFSILPVPPFNEHSVAFRINLMSAFFGALTSLFAFFCLKKLITATKLNERLEYNVIINLANIFGAALFAFGLVFWSQCVVAEVYTLNTAFITGLLFLLFLWSDDFTNNPETEPVSNPESKRKNRYLFLFSFFFGLSFGNHVSIGTYLPAYLFFIFFTEPKILLNYKKTLLSFALFFTGLLIYLYIPLRTHNCLNYQWLEIKSFEDFWWLVTAKNYNAIDKINLKTGVENFFNSYPSILGKELFFFLKSKILISILSGVTLLGIFRSLFIKPKYAITMLLIFGANVFYISCYMANNRDFYLPSFVMVSAFIGYGILSFLETLFISINNFIEKNKLKNLFRFSCFFTYLIFTGSALILINLFFSFSSLFVKNLKFELLWQYNLYLLGLFAAISLFPVLLNLFLKFKKPDNEAFLKIMKKVIFVLLLHIFSLFLGLQIKHTYKEDTSQPYFKREVFLHYYYDCFLSAKNSLEALPKNATALFLGDAMTPLVYASDVAGIRQDVKKIHLFLDSIKATGVYEYDKYGKVKYEKNTKALFGKEPVLIRNNWFNKSYNEIILPKIAKEPLFINYFDMAPDVDREHPDIRNLLRNNGIFFSKDITGPYNYRTYTASLYRKELPEIKPLTEKNIGIINIENYCNADYWHDPFTANPEIGLAHYPSLKSGILKYKDTVPFNILPPLEKSHRSSVISTCRVKDYKQVIPLLHQKSQKLLFALDGGFIQNKEFKTALIKILYEDGSKEQKELISGIDVYEYWNLNFKTTIAKDQLLWSGESLEPLTQKRVKDTSNQDLVAYIFDLDKTKIPKEVEIQSGFAVNPSLNEYPCVIIFAITQLFE